MADDTQAKQGGTKPQIAIYQKIASREGEIVDTLFDLLKSRNESVAVSAAKTLLAKILPDRKAVEVTGQDGEPIKINVIGGGFIPQSQFVNDSSTTSDFSTSTIQSVSVASESSEDDDSNSGDDPPSTN